MSDDHKSSPLDNAAIEKMVRSVFKGDPEQLTEPLLNYVCLLVNRHVVACRKNEIKPEIYRTVVEAIEDYRLMQKTGISVLDRAPDELVLPATRFLQYISPIGVRRRKQGGGDDTPLAPPLET
jgi:Fe-S-cluster containining protein